MVKRKKPVVVRNIYNQLIDPDLLEETPDFHSLVDRMYRLVGRGLKALENEQRELGPREVSTLASLSKVLPLLEQAESMRSTNDLKQMPVTQLRELSAQILRQLPAAADAPEEEPEVTLEDLADG